MKKFLILAFLLFLVPQIYSQTYIGKVQLKDSSGYLVITAPNGFKVNTNSWINIKDIDPSVVGKGLSYNPNLGIRFNAGNGLIIGSNDSVVTTGTISLGIFDSIDVGGAQIKSKNGNPISDSISANYAFILEGSGVKLRWRSTGGSIQDIPSGLNSGLNFSVPSPNGFHWLQSGNDLMDLTTASLQINDSVLNAGNNFLNVYGGIHIKDTLFLNNGPVTMNCALGNTGSGTSNTQNVDILVTTYSTFSKSNNLVLTLTDSYCKTNSIIQCTVMDGITPVVGENITVRVSTRNNGSCVLTCITSSSGGYSADFHIAVTILN